MNNYHVHYAFNGCDFYDVVNAESLQQAFEYLRWITEENNMFLLEEGSEITDEIATFYCPVGWTRPETREVARLRSLKTALANAGLSEDKWSEELDAFLKNLGYQVKETEDTDILGFTEKLLVYTRDGCASLEFPIA